MSISTKEHFVKPQAQRKEVSPKIFITKYLTQQLNQGGVDTSEWGKGKAKSIQELAEEVLEGESALVARDGELRRETSVAGIDILCTNPDGQTLKLVEVKQVWHDGSGRERSRELPQSMSEKMTAGENPVMAAIRGLKEELGITITAEQLTPLEPSIVTRTSDSYPGLMCQYSFFRFKVNLSPAEYRPEGYVEDDGKKYTYFEWRAVEQ